MAIGAIVLVRLLPQLFFDGEFLGLTPALATKKNNVPYSFQTLDRGLKKKLLTVDTYKILSLTKIENSISSFF